jgi:hypothetical protein
LPDVLGVAKLEPKGFPYFLVDPAVWDMSHPIQHEEAALGLPEDEQTRNAKARIGQTLGDRWHLDALLGIGGMAAVYAATHRNGKRVAMKLLHPELCRNAELKQRFLDESYAANRVGHQAAVSVLDDGVSEEGGVVLVMDLLEGETLEARIRRYGRLAPHEVLAVTDALLDVLAAAHEKEIVHRDVKPDNIFITREGVVKLLDFGIARMIRPGRPRTTQFGAAVGTPAFMPPEQARGRWEPLDGRTDIWAVGATMFCALTGRQVHEGETTNEELLLAMTQAAPSVGEIAPQLPRELVRIVDRALAFDKEDRWPSARAMQVAIRGAAAVVGGAFALVDRKRDSDLPAPSAAPVTLPTPPGVSLETLRPRPKQMPKSARVVVAAAAAILGLVVIVLVRGGRAQAPDEAAAATPPRGPAPALEATAAASEKEPTIAIETAQPVELASAEPEPAKPAEPKLTRAKPARALALDKAAPRGAVASPLWSTNTAAPPVAPAPTVLDPLERRK